MRSEPSFPVVNRAVRVLPLASRQRANRNPLRVKISAPAGIGFVTVFLNTVISIPLVQDWNARRYTSDARFVKLPLVGICRRCAHLIQPRRCLRHPPGGYG